MVELLTVLGICAVAAVLVGALALLMRWGRKLAATGEVAPEKLQHTDRVALVRFETRSAGKWVRFRNESERGLDRYAFRVRAMREGAVVDEIREVVFLPPPPGGEREVLLSLVDCGSGRTLKTDKTTVSVDALGGYEPWRMAPRAGGAGGIRRFIMGVAARSARLSFGFASETDPGRKMRSSRFSFYSNLVMALLWTWLALSWGDPGSLIMAPALVLLTLISGVQFLRARRKIRTMLR